jgi:hypothetical protein
MYNIVETCHSEILLSMLYKTYNITISKIKNKKKANILEICQYKVSFCTTPISHFSP